MLIVELSQQSKEQRLLYPYVRQSLLQGCIGEQILRASCFLHRIERLTPESLRASLQVRGEVLAARAGTLKAGADSTLEKECESMWVRAWSLSTRTLFSIVAHKPQ